MPNFVDKSDAALVSVVIECVEVTCDVEQFVDTVARVRFGRVETVARVCFGCVENRCVESGQDS